MRTPGLAPGASPGRAAAPARAGAGSPRSLAQPLALALAALLCTAAAGAQGVTQVGVVPELSPFRDMEYNHEFTLLSGWMSAGSDPAGVAPRGGPSLGIRYDIHFAGPLFGYVRALTVLGERTALDPGQTLARRRIGSFLWPVTFIDAGLETSLTGQKSWHGFMPVVSIGMGAYTDFVSGPDRGGYEFGTGFLFTIGAGVRWTPERRWQVRLELYDYLHDVTYPASYLGTPNGSVPGIIPAGSSRSFYRNNWSLQVGAAYTLFR
ncbi:MAG: hypothetical protein HYX65_06095 [Gemmatimonadetes bacterium]|nr:hypothetical protein [Gemmatimonadota bacterium]